MKKLALTILTLGMAVTAISGCWKKKGGSSGDTSIDDGKIAVNFYIDYNAITAGETYNQQRVEKGAKVSKPADPTEAPFPEFPVFKGWSLREITDNDDELWNFETDTINPPEGYRTVNIFGQWAAEGE